MPTGDIYDTDTNDTFTTTELQNWAYTPSIECTGELAIDGMPVKQSIEELNKFKEKIIKERRENMRYLYEVILVNPKNDTHYTNRVIARSETSALMEVYNESQFSIENNVPFDDLKTSCRVLMEWKKEKSLKKAIETIKEAIE